MTSIDRDGTRSGFDTDLLRAISDAVSVPVIASGGAAGPGGLRGRRPRRRRGRGARGVDLPPAACTRSPTSRRRWPPPACRSGSTTAPRRDVASPVDAVAAARRRPRPGGRPGRRRRPRADARLDGPRGARRDARDRRGPLPLAVARPPLAEGRDERQRAAARRRSPLDCDADALLRHGRPGRPDVPPRRRGSCFDPDGAPADAAARDSPGSRRSGRRSPSAAATRPEGSYTAKLLDGGVDAAGRKVTEEATEVLIAAKDDAAAEPAAPTATRPAPPSPARRPTCSTTRSSCSPSATSPRPR